MERLLIHLDTPLVRAGFKGHLGKGFWALVGASNREGFGALEAASNCEGLDGPPALVQLKPLQVVKVGGAPTLVQWEIASNGSRNPCPVGVVKGWGPQPSSSCRPPQVVKGWARPNPSPVGTCLPQLVKGLGVPTLVQLQTVPSREGLAAQPLTSWEAASSGEGLVAPNPCPVADRSQS